MMTHTKRLAASTLLTLLSLAGIHTAQAAMITGEIQFVGRANLDGNAATATTIDSVSMFMVSFGTDDYAGITQFDPTVGTFNAPFTFGALNTTGANVQEPLWSVNDGGLFYSFNLEAITLNTLAGAQRNIEGNGTANITGFDPTPGTWSINFSGASAMLSFSSNTIAQPVAAVSEPGSIITLFGIGILGLALLRRTPSS